MSHLRFYAEKRVHIHRGKDMFCPAAYSTQVEGLRRQLCASAQGLYWLLDRTDYSGEYAPTTSMHKTVARLCEARATAHTPTALHMDRVCVLRTTARGTSTGFGHALQIPQGGTCAAIELVTRAPKRYKHLRWHCTRSKGLRCV